MNLGNKAGVGTVVSMFYENPVKKKEEYLKQIQMLDEEKEMILKEMLRFEKEFHGEELSRSLQYMRLQYQLKLREEKISEADENMQKLKEESLRSSSCVIVDGVAYDGCRITFGKAEKILNEAQCELRFRRIGNEVVAESL